MAERPRVGVVGLGLIGGSVALRLHSVGHEVVVTDVDPATRDAAAGSGLVVEPGLGAWVQGCDLVVVSTPLDVLDDVLHRLAPLLAGHATVVDVGSVKGPVHRVAVAAGLGERFVGAHPMAGTEHTGFAHASPELCTGATWAVTVQDGTTDPGRAARVVRLLAEELDATVTVLAPEVHDRAAATISHVPHVVAHLLLAGAEESGHARLAGLLAAGSFRDGTRVAGTNPARTRNMLVENGEAVAAELARLRRRLDDIAALVARGDGDGLLRELDRVAARAGEVRDPQPPAVPADEVDAATVLDLLRAPGERVVVSPRRG